VGTVRLEIIAPLIAGARACQQCQDFFDDAGLAQKVNEEALRSYPAETWQDNARLSDLVQDLSACYGSQLRISLIDPQTPTGILKSLRHWVRRYPTFIVDGHAKYSGWDRGAVEALLRQHGAQLVRAAGG
jgi:hypothetical protein